MREDEKVSHLMKVLLRIFYQAPVDEKSTTQQVLSNGATISKIRKQKRVGRPKFERLPNVVPVVSRRDETDLVSYSHNRTRRSPSTS
ncbi:hypothetical protein TNCV_2815421 [Trichonephila clavipes]|nr:hypothetical protein TNCV_2815421 [Trichonephila clavipes]